MTLFELIFVALYLAIGVYVGSWGHQYFGWIGAVVGFISGAIGTVLTLIAVSRIPVGNNGRPMMPVCKNGNCDEGAYKCVGTQELLPIYQCECGDKYLAKGSEFLELLPDKTLKPYMKRSLFKGWISAN